MILPTRQYENQLYSNGYSHIAGIDEAGRGAWAGPLVAAAVIMPQNKIIDGVRDSKLLTPEKREILCNEIKKTALSWSVGIVEIDYINQYNIGRANVKAFTLAIEGLKIRPDYVMIDGVSNGIKEIKKLEIKKLGNDREYDGIKGNQKLGSLAKRVGNKKILHILTDRAICEYIKDGDARVYSIAAASIVAKATRDRILCDMHGIFPKYGFDKHKGYGTKLHSDALEKHGICEMHRILYKPIKRIMNHEL